MSKQLILYLLLLVVNLLIVSAVWPFTPATPTVIDYETVQFSSAGFYPTFPILQRWVWRFTVLAIAGGVTLLLGLMQWAVARTRFGKRRGYFRPIAIIPFTSIGYLLFITSPTTQAQSNQPLIVTCNANGTGSIFFLNEAIQTANEQAGADTIEIVRGDPVNPCRFAPIGGITTDFGRTAFKPITDTLTIIGNDTTITAIQPMRHFEAHAHLSLHNMRLTNGNANVGSKPSGDFGGAILALAGLRLDNVTLDNNRARVGSALYVDDGLVIENSLIENNSATATAAIRSSGNTIIFDSVLRENVSAGQNGGLTASNGFQLIIRNSRFENNQANGGSCGAVNAAFNTEMAMTNVQFTGNTATRDGGALCIEASSLTLTRSRFENNSSGNGGAIADRGRMAGVIDGNFFVNNVATSAGGGYFNSEGVVNSQALSLLNNVWIDNQSMDERGAAIALQLGSQTKLIAHNSIAQHANASGSAVYSLDAAADLRHNIITDYPVAIEVDNRGDAPVTVDNNLFFGNAQIFVGSVTPTNSLVADPLFVDHAGGDLQLSAESPAIDRVDELLVNFDVLGAPRQVGVSADLGAFEFGATVPTAVTLVSSYAEGNPNMRFIVVGSILLVFVLSLALQKGNRYRGGQIPKLTIIGWLVRSSCAKFHNPSKCSLSFQLLSVSDYTDNLLCDCLTNWSGGILGTDHATKLIFE